MDEKKQGGWVVGLGVAAGLVILVMMGGGAALSWMGILKLYDEPITKEASFNAALTEDGQGRQFQISGGYSRDHEVETEQGDSGREATVQVDWDMKSRLMDHYPSEHDAMVGLYQEFKRRSEWASVANHETQPEVIRIRGTASEQSLKWFAERISKFYSGNIAIEPGAIGLLKSGARDVYGNLIKAATDVTGGETPQTHNVKTLTLTLNHADLTPREPGSYTLFVRNEEQELWRENVTYETVNGFELHMQPGIYDGVIVGVSESGYENASQAETAAREVAIAQLKLSFADQLSHNKSLSYQHQRDHQNLDTLIETLDQRGQIQYQSFTQSYSSMAGTVYRSQVRIMNANALNKDATAAYRETFASDTQMGPRIGGHRHLAIGIAVPILVMIFFLLAAASRGDRFLSMRTFSFTAGILGALLVLFFVL